VMIKMFGQSGLNKKEVFANLTFRMNDFAFIVGCSVNTLQKFRGCLI